MRKTLSCISYCSTESTASLEGRKAAHLIPTVLLELRRMGKDHITVLCAHGEGESMFDMTNPVVLCTLGKGGTQLQHHSNSHAE